MPVIYAEDVGNYWKSSQTHAETWLEKAEREIVRAGGSVIRSAVATENGTSVILIEFQFGNDLFRSAWDVLPSKSGNLKAAKIQAATMLYHDIKDNCVKAKVRGFRRAFAEYLTLPGSNQTFGDLVRAASLSEGVLMLSGGSEIIEGEYK